MNRPLSFVLLLLLAAPAPAHAHHVKEQTHDMGTAAAPKAAAVPLYTDLGTWHHAVKTKSP